MPKKYTPEEKQFVTELRAILKKMPKHLCLIVPHSNGMINIVRKELLSSYSLRKKAYLNDAFDYEAFLRSIKVDAREDQGPW